MSPKVGGKHFEYTPKGMEAARKEHERTGKPMMKEAKMPMKKGK